MTKLAELKCTVCQEGDLPLTDAEIKEFLRQVPDWHQIETQGVKQLQRTFKFADYPAALAFTQAVGEIAQAAGHHPALLTEWGQVTVTWWTHKIHGLHENDFIMAAKTNQLYSREN